MSTLEELRILLRDEAGWKAYFESLNDLLASVAGFNSLLRDLRSELSGVTLGELIAGGREDLLKVVLGGFNVEKGSYEPGALGFYYRLLGIVINNKDLERFASRITSGDEPADAGKDVQVNIEDRVITRLLEALEGQLRNLADTLGLEAREKSYDNKDPKAALNALAEILSKSRALLPLYNRYSFILLSLNSTPAFYLRKAYGISFKQSGEKEVTIKADDVRKILKNYGVKLEVKLAPDIENQNARMELSIIGHADNSTGKIVVNIISIIYILFSYLNYVQREPKLIFFKGLKDELTEYIRVYENRVWDKYKFFTDKLRALPSYILSMYFELVKNLLEDLEDLLSRLLAHGYFYEHIKIRGGGVEVGYNKVIKFNEFEEYYAPLAFLGLAFIDINKGRIIIQKLGGQYGR